MLPIPNAPPTIDVIIVVDDVVDGGLVGIEKEITTNLQEGVPGVGFCLMFCIRTPSLTIVMTLELMLPLTKSFLLELIKSVVLKFNMVWN